MFQKKLRALMVACLLAPSSIALNAYAASPQSTTTNSECSYTKPPTNQVELLNNLLCLAKSSSKIEEGYFVDDEELWKLTSGQSFFRDYPLIVGQEKTYVTYFPSAIDHNTTSWQDRLSIDFSRLTKPFELRIQLRQGAGTQLSFDNVVEIFGTNWKRRSNSSYLHPHLSVPPKKISPYGNYQIDYTLANSSKEKIHVAVDFNHKGFAETIEIHVKRGGV